MPKKSKENLVALTVWVPKSLKEAANEVAQEYGDVSRMVRNGLRKEIAAKRLEISEPDIKAS